MENLKINEMLNSIINIIEIEGSLVKHDKRGLITYYLLKPFKELIRGHVSSREVRLETWSPEVKTNSLDTG